MVKEETRVEVKTATIDSSMKVIILLYASPAFHTLMPGYNMDIAGISMLDWVKRAAKGYPTICVNVGSDTDFLPDIAGVLDESKYTAILFSDTPLIDTNCLSDMLDYVVYKDQNLVKFTRAYVAKTEYLKKCENLSSATSSPMHQDMFYKVSDMRDLSAVRGVINRRINAYHMSCGVNILNPESVNIDAMVEIGDNVTVDGPCKILGASHIGDNCTIRDSRINASDIGAGATISHSVIEHCKIAEGSKVGPFQYLSDK